MSSDFTHTTLPALSKRVLRMGFAGNYGAQTADAHRAAERGINYWLWSRGMGKVTPAIRDILKHDREKHVVGFLAGTVLKGGVRRNLNRALKALGTDYVDIYQFAWLGRMSRFSDAIIERLLQLKEEGLIRSIGCSIHDRPRAGALARDSVLDTFMIRYNAKHPGAEQDIFPHVGVRNPNIISYTATSWRQLLKPFPDANLPPYPGEQVGERPPPMTPALCYRFVLTNPHVHVALTGPKNRAQLDENLDALEAGPLTDEERQWCLDYGAFVKSKKKGYF